MRKSCAHEMKTRGVVFAGLILVAAGTAVAQDDFPRVETAPGFSYVHNSPVLGGTQSFNCAGGGGTIAVNMSSIFGIAGDFSGCKAFGLDNTYGIGSKVGATEFTYVFGPRLTFMRKTKFHPFFELNFGGERVSIKCNNGNAGNACGAIAPGNVPSQLPSGETIIVVTNPGATSFSRNAFAMTVGGGFDIQLNKKIAIRLVQAEYLYTRFGNDCQFAVCNDNNNQNSFRLKSGIVVSWGGAQ
jgi:opacity protein-like surface antigen